MPKVGLEPTRGRPHQILSPKIGSSETRVNIGLPGVSRCVPECKPLTDVNQENLSLLELSIACVTFATPGRAEKTGATVASRPVSVSFSLFCLPEGSKPIDVFSVSDSHHQDEKGIISNLINDPVVPHLDTVETFHALQLLEPWRARVVSQGVNLRLQSFLHSRRQLSELPVSGGGKFDSIGHDLQPRTSFHLAPGNRLGPCSLHLF